MRLTVFSSIIQQCALWSLNHLRSGLDSAFFVNIVILLLSFRSCQLFLFSVCFTLFSSLLVYITYMTYLCDANYESITIQT